MSELVPEVVRVNILEQLKETDTLVFTLKGVYTREQMSEFKDAATKVFGCQVVVVNQEVVDMRIVREEVVND